MTCGIEHEKSAPYTPEQNGRCERDNRTIVEMARSMLYAKNLDEELWAEAVLCATYLLNRIPTIQAKGSTSFEEWTGKKLKLDHIRTFGSTVFEHVPNIKRTKWQPKAIKKIIVGYDEDSSNYRLFDPITKKMTISANVIFHEDRHEDVSSGWMQPTFSIDINTDSTSESTEESIENASGAGDEAGESKQRVLRNRSTIKKPIRYEAHAVNFEEPQTYSDAMSRADASKWKDAIELNALTKMETWVNATLPKDRKPISARWIFTRKRNGQGKVIRYKARLVARGYSQREGIDYTETFAFVVRYESVRTLLAVAAINNMKIGQFDIKTAFLNGELEEDIYMELPEGTGEEGRIVKLQRSLYGLKQSPRRWNKRFREFLKKFEFITSEADNYVYCGTINNEDVLLALYVDDGLLFAKSDLAINKVLEYLQNEFEVTVGNGDYFVGLEIQRNNEGNVKITQKAYLTRVIERFKMADSKGCAVPAYQNNISVMSSNDNKEELMTKIPYREAVGSLMFAAVVSRPDIMYAVANVSKFLTNPSQEHWQAVKIILRYIRNTLDVGIEYRKTEETRLIGYSDSDYAGDVTTRKSTSGIVFTLAGGAISWASKRQSVVAMSTTEAEYIAASDATKEAIWLRRLLNDIGFGQKGSTILNVDNQGAIKLIHNPELHKRTKHIDVRYHFIREKVNGGEIKINYLKSEEQLADLFTKALPKQTFLKLRSNLLIK